MDLTPVTAYLLPDGRLVRSKEEAQLILIQEALHEILSKELPIEQTISHLMGSDKIAIFWIERK